MQQTLLALLALMMATFLNYSQMQADLQHQREVVRSEMQEMAAGIAMQTMEVIRARAFDEEVADGEEIDEPSDLSDPDFDTGNQCQAFFEGSGEVCNDIDDFHKMETATVPFNAPEFDMQFAVDVVVRYVDHSMEPVDERTYRKEVIIKVQDKREDPYLHEPIRFSEVLTLN